MDFSPWNFSEIFEIIRLENTISFAKIMLLERFCNVVQTFLNTKTAKFFDLRPKIRKGSPLTLLTVVAHLTRPVDLGEPDLENPESSS